ncbi:hypothetical protein EU534_00050 [Candidatus Heimdallarchaeota archaeon]|nr:MAG: hypothetical protein EU534_00050 [Candidatus Heimdallarchaeota archaeon]
MENWLDTYFDVLNAKLYEIKRDTGVVLGFNVNIDKIIKISSNTFAGIITPEVANQLNLEEYPTHNIIENRLDFLSCLLQSIKYERADEVITNSQELCNWVEETFQVEESKIGGQAGIIANLYNELGMKQVLLSLPHLNNELYSLLNTDILAISEEGNDYSINKISSPNSDVKLPIYHYVFEFEPGSYIVGDYTIENRRANRFILSHDMINTKLEFSKGLLVHCDKFINRYSLAIVSGFHLVNKTMNSSMSFSEIFQQIKSMLIRWREINPDLCIHLEIASTRDQELRRTIVSILFKLVDSIGLNEQELISFIEMINQELADDLKKHLTPISVFNALKQILDKYPNLRIHFHYLGYFMILSKPITSKYAIKRRRGLILASLLAAIRVKGLDTISLEDVSNIPLDISIKGSRDLDLLYQYLKANYSEGINQNEMGVFYSHFFTLVGIPTIVVNKPKRTVGLGDLISSISILYESQ